MAALLERVMPPHEVLPKALLELYTRGDDQNLLGAVDWLTLRDLLILSGHDDHDLCLLLVCLVEALNEGSLCIVPGGASLARRLERRREPNPQAASTRLLKALRGNAYPNLVTSDAGAFMPLVFVDGPTPRLYFQRYHHHEQRLRELLLRRANADDMAPKKEWPRLKRALGEVLRAKPIRLGDRVADFDSFQQTALCLGLLRRFCLISGGPGTGKTSIVLTLLRGLVRAGVAVDRIRLAAPTGRAAQRITETIRAAIQTIEDPSPDDLALADLSAMTIHRLLRYAPSRHDFVHHALNPLPADVVVVDEVSMVDVCLMSNLLEATPDNARLILMGDKDQLPSVDAGAVLADLVPARRVAGYDETMCQALKTLANLDEPRASRVDALTDRIVVLEKTHRSEKSIMALARAVNSENTAVVDAMPVLEAGAPSTPRHGQPPVAAQVDWPEPGVGDDAVNGYLLPGPSTPTRVHAVLLSWARRAYLEGAPSYADLANRVVDVEQLEHEDSRATLDAMFDRLLHARILMVLRQGPLGSEFANHLLAQAMRSAFDPGSRGPWYAGLPVMISRNDYGHALFNGDVGVVVRGTDGGYHAVFPKLDGYVVFSVENLPAHDPAFAITVHKSQGSEYDRVLLVLPDDPEHRLLTREVLYTGLTRAKSLVVVLGTPEAMRAGIARRIERESGLDLWYAQADE